MCESDKTKAARAMVVEGAVSYDDAVIIAHAYQEVVSANAIRERILELIEDGADVVDPFGRKMGLRMETPKSGSGSSWRVMSIDPATGLAVIDAHISKKKRDLREASERIVGSRQAQ
ncbi:MAG: hypothetical protein WBF53_06410 [Litorimonas sp.]